MPRGRCSNCHREQSVLSAMGVLQRCQYCHKTFKTEEDRSYIKTRDESLSFPDLPIFPTTSSTFDDSSMSSTPDTTPDSGGFDGGGGGDFGGGGASGDF